MDNTKIIVVEDNIVYCEFVCNLLARKGFRAALDAQGGQDAAVHHHDRLCRSAYGG